MYLDDQYRKVGVQANWRLTNHSEGDAVISTRTNY